MNLERTLQYEQVVHLDLNAFTTVKTGTTVKAAIEMMRLEENHCAIVINQGKLIGIFTDRDILNKVVDNPDIWEKPIDGVMTPSPFTVLDNDPADKALVLMDQKHFRNVPVLNEHGMVLGTLTHYAVIKYLADNFPESVYNLPPNPEKISSSRDGA